jgi:hypothetical protein
MIDFLINRVNKLHSSFSKENYSPACWHYKHSSCPFYNGHDQNHNNQPELSQDLDNYDPRSGSTPETLDEAIHHEEEKQEELVQVATRTNTGRPKGYTHSNQVRGPVAQQSIPENSIYAPRGIDIEVSARPAPNVTGPITYSAKVADRIAKRSQQGIVVPRLAFSNEVVAQPLYQKNAGHFPPKNFLKIPKVVGNNEFVIVKALPFANPNHSNISGHIYQDRSYGRFYTAGGQCIKTDKQGYIITYLGKGGRPYPALWYARDPKKAVKRNDNKPTKAVTEAFAQRDTLLKKYNLKSVKNSAWKSGSKDPKQITLDCKTNAPYKMGTYPEYDQFLMELRKTIKDERGKRVQIRKDAAAKAKSSSPNRKKESNQRVTINSSSKVDPALVSNIARSQHQHPLISKRRRLRGRGKVSDDDNVVIEPNQSSFDYKVNVGGISYALTKEEYDLNIKAQDLAWKSSSKKKFSSSIPYSSDALQEEKKELPKEDENEPWLHSVQHSDIIQSQNRIRGVAFDDLGLITSHYYVHSSHPKSSKEQ